MKKILLITALFLLAVSTYLPAQTIHAPLSVKAELKKRYPNAAKVTWTKDNSNYEARWGGKTNEENAAVFTPRGALIKTSTPSDTRYLPVVITNYVKAHYHAAIKKARKSADVVGKLFYEIELTTGKKVVFDDNGKFIR